MLGAVFKLCLSKSEVRELKAGRLHYIQFMAFQDGDLKKRLSVRWIEHEDMEEFRAWVISRNLRYIHMNWLDYFSVRKPGLAAFEPFEVALIIIEKGRIRLTRRARPGTDDKFAEV